MTGALCHNYSKILSKLGSEKSSKNDFARDPKSQNILVNNVMFKINCYLTVIFKGFIAGGAVAITGAALIA